MSAEILFTQRLLKAQGFYRGALDGIAGPATAAALADASKASIAIAASIAAASQIPKFDDRSEANISTLHLKAQRLARLMLAAVVGKMGIGIGVKVICGTRTYPEQDALYAQGRTAGGNIVTKAKGGESDHNFGLAWDVGVFDHGNYLKESPLYTKVARAALDAVPGLEWGGDWHSIEDTPHFQVATGLSIGATRILFEAGSDYVK